MNKNILWALAIAAILGPCLYMQSGTADAMGGAAKMALAQQMRVQAMVMEAELGDSMGATMQVRLLDETGLREIVARLNSQNGGPMSPEAEAELRKQGVNPKMAPKYIPWVVAPDKQPRSLSISIVGQDLLIQGWGPDLSKPLYEHHIRGIVPERP